MTGMGQPAFTPGELESIIETYTAEQATITAKINENAQDIREAERENIILANANLVLQNPRHLEEDEGGSRMTYEIMDVTIAVDGLTLDKLITFFANETNICGAAIVNREKTVECLTNELDILKPRVALLGTARNDLEFYKENRKTNDFGK